jgi:hypothetical protein
MKQSNSKKPVALSFNVEHWRHEIQTFVESTLDEIREIQSDLSSGVRGAKSARERNRNSNGVKLLDDRNGAADGQSRIKEAADAQTGAPGFADRQAKTVPGSPSEERLFAIKKKLAERINTFRLSEP